MTQTPSSGAGATPGAGTPATGTPAAGGATPQPATLTLEEALKKITELELHAQNKTEEASRHGTKLTAAEKELAAYKAAEQAARDAQLTETQKLQKQYEEVAAERDVLSQEVVESRVLADVAKYGPKLKFRIDDAEELAKLIDWKAVEFDDETGKPTNVQKLLEALAKKLPKLVDDEPAQQQQRQGAPATPAMNPGRSSIAQPGGNVPGKIPRLTDLEWKH